MKRISLDPSRPQAFHQITLPVIWLFWIIHTFHFDHCPPLRLSLLLKAVGRQWSFAGCPRQSPVVPVFDATRWSSLPSLKKVSPSHGCTKPEKTIGKAQRCQKR